ncbi:MAG: ribosome silencing factor [Firmicutes bacterium]|nr:ribosome silencing factor [Bacillota bacterium]
MEPVALARLAYEAAVERKAHDVQVLDVSNMTTVADYFVIASAPNKPHVEAIAGNVMEKLEKAGVRAHHVEGRGPAAWLLLDYGSVIVHVFHEDMRAFYNLERLWGDAKSPDLDLASPVSYN